MPGQADYLSMLAKQWSDLTFYYDVNTDKERQLVNLKALEYADKVGAAGGGVGVAPEGGGKGGTEGTLEEGREGRESAGQSREGWCRGRRYLRRVGSTSQ